ncbi:MAG: hypothetical protein HRF43_01545 [Phycisphaerae bacterium]|jgi:hypothetical protein
MTHRRITEQDEFLLNRLIDGDLTEGQAAELRARMELEPELRTAFRRLERLGSLLSARRADRPAVDWGAFHRQVMARVERESRPAVPLVFKLRRYLGVAVPLAAAAAIVLVVWLSQRGSSPARPGLGPDTVAEYPTPPAPGPTGTDDQSVLVVRFARLCADAENETIVVAYARSEELQKEYQGRDDLASKQESSGALVAADRLPQPAIPRAVLAAAIAAQF